jgi:hypothetical protein
MAGYSENVVANTDFFGERGREIGEQEIDRAKSLDTKSTAIIAGCVALTGACGVFVLNLAALEGAGSGARALWAAEIGVSLLALLVAGGLAVWAIAPMVVRSQVGYHEMEKWTTPSVLETDPTLNEGTLVNASLHSIGISRIANKKKTDRLRWSSIAFGVALAAIVAMVISVAVHSIESPATQALDSHGRSSQSTERRAGRSGAASGGGLHVPDARNGSGAEGGPGRGSQGR